LPTDFNQQGISGKRGPLIHVSNSGGPVHVVPILVMMLVAVLLVTLFKGPRPPRG